jgi:hypothetical protein
MKKISLFVLVFFAFFNCNNLSKSNEDCQKNCLFLASLSTSDSDFQCINDSAFLKLIVKLNQSRQIEAFAFAKSNFKLEDVTYNGFKGLSVSNEDTSFWNAYGAYRLSSYTDDLDYNTLGRILTTNYYEAIKSTDSTCMKTLLDIEDKYIPFFMDDPKGEGNNNIDQFKIFLFKYPSSKRIKYMWGNLLYKYGYSDSALKIFKNLYRSEYYQIPILRILANHYDKLDRDSLRFYVNELVKLDPSACNIGKISLNLQEKEYGSIETECQKCLSGDWGMKDSMKAEIYLSKYYLERHDFSKVRLFFKKYQKGNKEFVFDNFKIWEEGEMYDLYLKSLFLEKKYTQLKSFAMSRVGLKGKIEIKNETDFRNLMKIYFTKYFFDSDNDHFDLFYNKNFR